MACRGDCVGMGARAKIVSKRRVNRAFGATDGGARDSIPGVTLEASTFIQAVIENTLRSCQLFMGLPTTDIVAIASFVVPKHLDKGDYLFREGDRSEGFYVVQKGRDQCSSRQLRGKRAGDSCVSPHRIVCRSNACDRGRLSRGCTRD